MAKSSYRHVVKILLYAVTKPFEAMSTMSMMKFDHLKIASHRVEPKTLWHSLSSAVFTVLLMNPSALSCISFCLSVLCPLIFCLIGIHSIYYCNLLLYNNCMWERVSGQVLHFAK